MPSETFRQAAQETGPTWWYFLNRYHLGLLTEQELEGSEIQRARAQYLAATNLIDVDMDGGIPELAYYT